MKLFSCYEKRLHSPFLPLHRQNKEVWVSGLNQHTANVPNRKVPKVRNRLQRAQKPSLLGLCRASGDSQRNPSASALWLVSSVGSEHDATNVGVGSSSLSRVTTLEVWQSWSIAPVLKTGRRQRLKGSNPLASANLPYRITVVRQILDLQVVVRFHLGRQVKKQLHGVIGSMPDFGSGGGGSNPSGVYMEFVAQLVECQVVALVVMGSIPIKLPNASIAQW